MILQIDDLSQITDMFLWPNNVGFKLSLQFIHPQQCNAAMGHFTSIKNIILQVPYFFEIIGYILAISSIWVEI